MENVPYPRRRVRRNLLRWSGRILLSMLTRTEVTGLQNFPTRGPLLVVGNHIATMEVVLMVVYAPWQMELLGPGDIPPPPMMDAIARMHGYIPINRGNMDRAALNHALGILKQGGVLGMFPEGGIWDTGEKPAKSGVAWLSYHARAPILPIGFGGLEGALNAAMKLKRPALSMHVGPQIPAVTVPPGMSRKLALQNAAQHVMDEVNALIPEQYQGKTRDITDETFKLHLRVFAGEGQEIVVPPGLTITQTTALCKMWYRPAILRIFEKDIGLDVRALQLIVDQPRAADIAQAISLIQGYLHSNPGFFTYRFGFDEGRAMEKGLEELKILAQWTDANNFKLAIQPTRRYRIIGQLTEIEETRPGEAHTW